MVVKFKSDLFANVQQDVLAGIDLFANPAMADEKGQVVADAFEVPTIPHDED